MFGNPQQASAATEKSFLWVLGQFRPQAEKWLSAPAGVVNNENRSQTKLVAGSIFGVLVRLRHIMTRTSAGRTVSVRFASGLKLTRSSAFSSVDRALPICFRCVRVQGRGRNPNLEQVGGRAFQNWMPLAGLCRVFDRKRKSKLQISSL